MNNSELLNGCLHNDNSAQRFFYDHYSPRIMGICMRYASGLKDTEAMVLYIFKKLYEELQQCPADIDMKQWVEEKAIWHAIAYLHQDKQRYFIAKTTRYMENKNGKVEVASEAEISEEDSRKLYLAALHALTPSYRIIYNLTYIDKVKPEQIIQNLEIATETYRVELEGARFQFKQYLNTYLHEHGLRKQ
jgi:RNA polymerase sigma factor (sigma-70 family)